MTKLEEKLKELKFKRNDYYPDYSSLSIPFSCVSIELEIDRTREKIEEWIITLDNNTFPQYQEFREDLQLFEKIDEIMNELKEYMEQ